MHVYDHAAGEGIITMYFYDVCVVSIIHPKGRTHATTKLHEGTGFYSQSD